MFYRILSFLSLFLLISCSNSDNNRGNVGDETDPGRQLDYTAEIIFLKPEGAIISKIDAAVADDNESRNEGLMNVQDLPDDAGMLFIFNNEEERSFWMANTPLSLDIIFINSEMKIVRIHRNTKPYSQESIRSEAPAQYVVEVNAGYTLAHDITEGMRIQIEGWDR